MSYRLLASSAFICALALVGSAGQADAARLSPNGASSLIILAGDEENSEIQNELDPESDSGEPGGPSMPAAPEEKAKPEGGGGSGATIEKELQEDNQP
jgi:hypothetical protein